jgi:hypothetical protein
MARGRTPAEVWMGTPEEVYISCEAYIFYEKKVCLKIFFPGVKDKNGAHKVSLTVYLFIYLFS